MRGGPTACARCRWTRGSRRRALYARGAVRPRLSCPATTATPGSRRRCARAGSSRSPATGRRPRAGRSTGSCRIRPTPAAWGDIVAHLVDGAAAAPYRARRMAGAAVRPPSSVPRAPLRGAARRRELAAQAMGAGALARARRCARRARHRAGVVGGRGRGATRRRMRSRRSATRRLRAARPRADVASARRCALLVAPDTGIAHLGRIVGVPTVALFGPGSALICGAGEFWRDAPYRAVTVDPFPCRDQRVLFKRDIAWVRRCGRSVARMPGASLHERRSASDAVDRPSTALLGARP